MAVTFRVPSMKVLTILLLFNCVVFISYWITRLGFFPTESDQYAYVKSRRRNVATIGTPNAEDTPDLAIEVLRTDSLPVLHHEDIFTEFDDVVIDGLYEPDEFIHDLRYDRHRGVDPMTIANANYSTMKITNAQNSYKVNDEIRVSIVIQSGFNKRILRGGDRIRIWIKEPRQGACANGYLLDHRNGTYTGIVRVLWPGRIQIVAGIAATREAIRVLYEIHRDGYKIRQLFGIFQRKYTYEMMQCAYTPHLPYEKVCNLTGANHGLPWYCGHPDFLTCAEWTKTGASQPPWQLYKEDLRLFDERNIHQNLRNSPQVAVLGEGSELNADVDSRKLLRCNEQPPSRTWSRTSPVGYFLKWRWRAMSCVNSLPNTVRTWNECFKNRRIWLHGDSTLRQWFTYLRRRQNLKLVSEKWHYDQWPYPSILYSEQHNYAVFWATHELPFTNTEEFVLRLAHKATHLYIDELPAGNRDIVVVHLYLHFSSFPPTLLRTHIRRIVKSVTSLLERAPAAKVFVKGPHAFHDHGYKRGVIDDYWGTIHSQIYSSEFETLRDRVYFLDYWDMTVAAESDDAHPNATLYDAQIQYMLGYICP